MERSGLVAAGCIILFAVLSLGIVIGFTVGYLYVSS